MSPDEQSDWERERRGTGAVDQGGQAEPVNDEAGAAPADREAEVASEVRCRAVRAAGGSTPGFAPLAQSGIFGPCSENWFLNGVGPSDAGWRAVCL